MYMYIDGCCLSPRPQLKKKFERAADNKILYLPSLSPPVHSRAYGSQEVVSLNWYWYTAAAAQYGHLCVI